MNEKHVRELGNGEIKQILDMAHDSPYIKHDFNHTDNSIRKRTEGKKIGRGEHLQLCKRFLLKIRGEGKVG